jgi:hypothetical protein
MAESKLDRPIKCVKPPTDSYTPQHHTFFANLSRFSTRAEVLVVLYIYRHTVGFAREDGLRSAQVTLTYDEIANGRFNREAERMDDGTGLSMASVNNGIKRAVENGWIVREKDESDAARVSVTYGIVPDAFGLEPAIPATDGKPPKRIGGMKPSDRKYHVDEVRVPNGEEERLPF